MKAVIEYLHNQFLPEYWNKEKTVIPAQQQSQFRALPKEINLDDVFCIKFTRKVGNDGKISIYGDKYRIKGYTGTSITFAQVEVRQGYNLKLFCMVRGQKCDLEKLVRPEKGSGQNLVLVSGQSRLLITGESLGKKSLGAVF